MNLKKTVAWGILGSVFGVPVVLIGQLLWEKWGWHLFEILLFSALIVFGIRWAYETVKKP